jgi:hypothetical protein
MCRGIAPKTFSSDSSSDSESSSSYLSPFFQPFFLILSYSYFDDSESDLDEDDS